MIFKMHEIRELIRLIDESQIEEFEIDNEGAKIVIKKVGGRATTTTVHAPQVTHAVHHAPSVVTHVAPEAPAPAVQAVAATPAPAVVEDANLHKIVSPMVGTFYAASSPDVPPYVQEGDSVTEKKVVCIVEAMKLMNEIEAEINGTIVKVLVQNGQLVEYGQPLFLVKTN